MVMIPSHLLKLLLIILCCSNSLASQIEVEGNTKTSKEAILRISRLNYLTKDKERIAKNNLLRSGLFIDAQVKKENKKTVIHVKEKWTTIPILKFNSGGGVGQTTLGVFDPNIAGEALELGAQYTRLGKTNSGVLWHKFPYIKNSPFSFEVQLWKINRLRTKYNQNQDEPAELNGFLQTRDQFLLGLTNEVDAYNQIKLTTQYHNDVFSNDLVPLNVKNSLLPPRSHYQLISLELKSDHFNYGPLERTGYSSLLRISHAISLKSDQDNFQILEFEGFYNRRITQNLLWANRLQIGGTNTDILQYWFYRGGLQGIRGFLDNRFAGKYLMLLNSELRQNLYHHSKFILQGNFFADLINIKEKFDPELTGASTGLGLRLVLPQFYRFVIRIDYAIPLIKDDDNALSFGVQHFF